MEIVATDISNVKGILVTEGKLQVSKIKISGRTNPRNDTSVRSRERKLLRKLMGVFDARELKEKRENH